MQYLILCVLACQLAARMMEDYRRIAPYAGKVVLILGSVAGWIFYSSEGWRDRFLDTEIAVSAFLCALILVGWWMRKKQGLEWPLSGVVAGMMVWVAGSGICAMAWKYWPLAGQLYWIPEIAALLIWNWSGIAKKKEAMRQELPPRMPVESVGLSRQDEQFLKGMRISA